jgi:hypothetical protein
VTESGFKAVTMRNRFKGRQIDCCELDLAFEKKIASRIGLAVSREHGS